MSIAGKLKDAKSRDDLALLLGYKASSLSYILYKMAPASKYVEFEIAKRSGGKRKISAPVPKLKLLQRHLANILYQYLLDIEKLNKPRRPLSHGFAKSLSIVTNASVHKRRRYVLNFDLKDFFPSIHFGRVRGVLIKDKRFELNKDVATAIAQIACHENSLPQGSPCSPVLSNIVSNILDIRLARLARANKCTYSRYADDLTFSTNRKEFPSDLAFSDSSSAGKWLLGPALVKEIEKTGFEINETKTRMQVRGSRQVTTGLLVNEKVNIRPEYYRNARAMCSSLFTVGSYYRLTPATLADGKLGDPELKETLTSIAPLEGMVSHIYHVRNKVDQRQSADKKKVTTATRRLYRKLLFYRHFVNLDEPLILTEGTTDSIYLRSAIERLTDFHPKLGSIVDGKLKLTIRTMNYTGTVHDVLQIGGGTGDFKHFILGYKEALKKYRHLPLLFPVIVLIDNDDGAKDIFSVVKQMGDSTISHKATQPFFRLHSNLYLIKTPEIGTKGLSCIEDLFDPTVRATELDGKKFDPNKKHEELGKYGKTIFAEKIIRPNRAAIDFSKFALLLNRIIAVVDDHKANPILTT